MVSVQNSRLLHVPRLVTWLMRDQKGLSTMDNEIWLEKIHFKLFLLADRPALRAQYQTSVNPRQSPDHQRAMAGLGYP